MNIKTEIKLHNKFEIVKITNGEVTQRGFAENIVLDRMFTRICGMLSYFDYIHFGAGAGAPVPSRTTLFSSLGYKSAVTDEVVRAYPNSRLTRKITLLPSEFVGAVITEVGISESASAINTHALIKDAEGNLINITKTALDVVEIYATVFVQLADPPNGVSWGWTLPYGTAIVAYLTNPAWGASTTIKAVAKCKSAKNLSIKSTVTKTVDSTNKKLTFGPIRFDIADANDVGINTIGLITSSYYFDQLANVAEIIIPSLKMPTAQITNGLVSGEVDGSNLVFGLPWDQIKSGTLSLYNNGVMVPSNVYTIKYDQVTAKSEVYAGLQMVEQYGEGTLTQLRNSGFGGEQIGGDVKIFTVDDCIRTYGLKNLTYSSENYTAILVAIKRFGSTEWENIYVHAGYSSIVTNFTAALTVVDWSDVEFLKIHNTSTADTSQRRFTVSAFASLVSLPTSLINFNPGSAPVGGPLTATYQTNCIPKTSNYVLDATFTIQFGEGV